MLTLRTIIVEDDLSSQLHLQRIIQNHCLDIQLLGMAENIEAAVAMAEGQEIDFLFLNTRSNLVSSIGESLDEIESKNFKIVFTTDRNEFALQACEHNAVDYIMKPYSPMTIMKAVSKVRMLDRLEKCVPERSAA